MRATQTVPPIQTVIPSRMMTSIPWTRMKPESSSMQIQEWEWHTTIEMEVQSRKKLKPPKQKKTSKKNQSRRMSQWMIDCHCLRKRGHRGPPGVKEPLRFCSQQ